jgi:RNA polymerase sigma-70 factor, ECF subfamily
VAAGAAERHTGEMASDTGPSPNVTTAQTGESFDEIILPHLDAAYRLARWLIHSEPDAEDAVQEAALRAFRYFRTFAGGNARAWFLRIVRNTCNGWRRGVPSITEQFDEERHSDVRPASDPEMLLLQTDDVVLIERTMRRLPDRFRELLVLRELEDLSYREMADVMDIPIGTVMSGLSRARQAFRVALEDELNQSTVSAHTRKPEEEADEVLV